MNGGQACEVLIIIKQQTRNFVNNGYPNEDKVQVGWVSRLTLLHILITSFVMHKHTLITATIYYTTQNNNESYQIVNNSMSHLLV